MQKKIRKIIFILVLLGFIFFAPLLLLKSQGIQFDFQQKRFVKSGGIFISTLTPSAEVWLDGKFKKNTNFVFNSVFMKNLLPKKYKIELKKQNYFSWQKTVEVKEGKVTELRNILLVKKNISFEILAEDIENFWVSEDSRDLLIERTIDEKSNFLILDTFLKEEKEIFSENSPKIETKTKLIAWNSTQKQILFQKEEENFFVLDYSTFPAIQTFKFSLGKNNGKIVFNPANEEEILFIQGNNLFRKNFVKNTKEEIFLSDVVWFEVQNGNLFLFSSSGFLSKTNYFLQKKEVLNKTPFLFNENEDFKIKPSKEGLFFGLSKELYYLTSDGDSERIFSDLKDFEISPDLERLSFWGGQEIWIFEEKKDTRLYFLNRFSEALSSLYWINPHYLIFNTGDDIRVSEISNNDYLNIFTIKTLKNPKIFFNKTNKKLYVLSGGFLFASQEPIP